MESYIPISYINDFLFCPRSIYLHSVYNAFNKKTYHSSYQTRGSIAHESIDAKSYSSRKTVLQGTAVYSDEFQIMGKIDLFDTKTGLLTERKYKIKQIFPGYKYQLYAQYFCLTEMGHDVRELALYSRSDNKKYPIEIPMPKEKAEFSKIIQEIKKYSAQMAPILDNPNKCDNCIYRPLCH